MASGGFRALILSALLTLAAPCLADDAQRGPGPDAANRSIAVPLPADGPIRAPAASTDDAASQTLSMLVILSLGVLGLLWVRRHTARL